MAMFPQPALYLTDPQSQRLWSSSLHNHWLEIDLNRLGDNIAAWRRFLAEDRPARAPRLCVVVKANAYGLGSLEVARTAVVFGARSLAVFSLEEARPLAAALPATPILVLGTTFHLPWDDESLTPAIRRRQLHFSAHHLDELQRLSDAGQRLATVLPVHLHIDTGMSRGGIDPAQASAMIAVARKLPHVRLVGAYSHFAAPQSDPEFTRQQADIFDKSLSKSCDTGAAPLIRHLASSGGAVHRPYHLDMVRIGLGMYGLSPHEQGMPAMRHVVRWCSRVAQVQSLPAGATVGYERTHTLARPSTIALVPAGYAAGFPLSASHRAMVELPERSGRPQVGRPRLSPVVGRVNMDQIAIDVTNHDVQPGDPVTLISNDPASPVALPHVAQWAQTSCYELLCRIGASSHRHYLGGRWTPPDPMPAA